MAGMTWHGWQWELFEAWAWFRFPIWLGVWLWLLGLVLGLAEWLTL